MSSIFSTPNNFAANMHPSSPRFTVARLLRTYLQPQLPHVIGMSIALLAALALQLANPQVIQYFLDTAGSDAPFVYLTRAAILFILFSFAQQGFKILAGLLAKQVGWTATNHLRADLMQHCLRLGMSFHKQHTPGEMIERIDGDVGSLGNFFSEFWIRLIANALLILGILILMALENPWLGVGMTIYVVLTFLALGLFQRPAQRQYILARQANAEQYGYLEERISGVEEIQTAGAIDYSVSRFLGIAQLFLRVIRRSYVLGSLVYNLTNLLHGLGYVAGLALGVWLYLQGKVTLGTVYLITYYVGMLANPLQNLRSQAQDFQKAAASLDRVGELFAMQPSETNVTTPYSMLPAAPIAIKFDHVSFHYDDDADVIHNLSFEIPPGQTVGILGRTGGGKSTLARLIVRLHDPSSGSIYLNGISTTEVNPAELRSHVAMVTQDVQLFAAPLRDNLSFFDPAITKEKIQEVLAHLGLWEWVAAMPQGLDTVVQPAGEGFSAGEAQLLAFARVFLKNPDLVILDEASSRLDPLTEARLDRAIATLLRNRTALVIAHRLKTVRQMDWILIMDGGRVAEFDRRESLSADPQSLYSRLLETGLEEVIA